MKVPETYRYVNLIKANTPYANNMKFLSNRIFGEVGRPTSCKSMKVVKIYSAEPLYKMENIVNYYPRHTEMGYLFQFLREYGLYRDEHLDFIDEMKRLRALRGKVDRPFGSGQKESKKLIDTR